MSAVKMAGTMVGWMAVALVANSAVQMAEKLVVPKAALKVDLRAGEKAALRAD